MHSSTFIPPIQLCRFFDDIFSVFQDPISAALFFNTFNTPRLSIKVTFDITSVSPIGDDKMTVRNDVFLSKNIIRITSKVFDLGQGYNNVILLL